MQTKQTLTYAASLLGATLAVSTLAPTAHAGSLRAGEKFGTNGILFETDTTVDFEFLRTHGKYQSSLKLFEVTSDGFNLATTLFEETKSADDPSLGQSADWIGTCGNTVMPGADSCTASYLFKAGMEYTLGLDSGSDGIVYSTSDFNTDPDDTQQTVFAELPDDATGSSSVDAVFDRTELGYEDTTAFESPGDFTAADPFEFEVGIGFDDRGNGNDVDFQDKLVFAQASRDPMPVPEPSVTFGLVAVAAGLGLRRNRKRNR